MMRMHAELRTREALGPFGSDEEKNAPDVLYTAGDTALLTEGSRVALITFLPKADHDGHRYGLVTLDDPWEVPEQDRPKL